ncbi:MAG: glycosyltransferase [bacterium]
MKVLMMTNTYYPFVGGVSRSVDQFTKRMRSRGHDVKILAPEFEGDYEDPSHVIRVPALKDLNGSGYSIPLTVPRDLKNRLGSFTPELIHSHHPFGLGMQALRLGNRTKTPVVFTHHTRYEEYTHNLQIDTRGIKQYARTLATGYANLADRVIAPSSGIQSLIEDRGVESPVNVVPTGVEVDRFQSGQGDRVRDEHGIPKDADLIGHVGRLSAEKNLPFLIDSLENVLSDRSDRHLLIVGDGEQRKRIQRQFRGTELEQRVHLPGVLEGKDLVDAYHSMDLFGFASTTETQGMVLTEAMATGCPVVALKATGVNDVVEAGKNGFSVAGQDCEKFARAVNRYLNLSGDEQESMSERARTTAKQFSMDSTCDRLERTYEEMSVLAVQDQSNSAPLIKQTGRQVKTEWNLFTRRLKAVRNLVKSGRAGVKLRYALREAK